MLSKESSIEYLATSDEAKEQPESNKQSSANLLTISDAAKDKKE